MTMTYVLKQGSPDMSCVLMITYGEKKRQFIKSDPCCEVQGTRESHADSKVHRRTLGLPANLPSLSFNKYYGGLGFKTP